MFAVERPDLKRMRRKRGVGLVFLILTGSAPDAKDAHAPGLLFLCNLLGQLFVVSSRSPAHHDYPYGRMP